jgi:hypothetical protein
MFRVVAKIPAPSVVTEEAPFQNINVLEKAEIQL